MLSLDFICQHPQKIRDALKKRGETRNIDEILRLAEQRRGLITRNDGLYTALKQLKSHIRTIAPDKRSSTNQTIKATIHEIRQLELQINDLDTRLHLLLLDLPNLPHSTVQEDEDPEVSSWGQPISWHFEPQPHWTLGQRLGIVDAGSGTRIAGNRFITLKGGGARLERALISYMLDVHTREHHYTEILPPFLARRSALLGAGQLPKFQEQVYHCEIDDLFLNPTAEVPLLALHSDSILAGEDLPLRYAGWTTAFRRESVSTSLQSRGLLRLHQFNKIELFQFATPQNSYSLLEEMVEHAALILRRLELPYRVVALSAHNLPFAAAKTFDLEVWMPAQECYIEVSSISNCETFQARRSNIKFRHPSSSRIEYPHTLNASGLAVGRTMAALLETYQQADGSIIIPKVLRPYMGTNQLSP